MSGGQGFSALRRAAPLLAALLLAALLLAALLPAAGSWDGLNQGLSTPMG